jgi:flavin-binding protein dodecin
MPTKKYSGTSKGDFQEALAKALAKAENSTGGADFLIKWTFVSAKGEKGGITGKNSLTVTIEATW